MICAIVQAHAKKICHWFDACKNKNKNIKFNSWQLIVILTFVNL